ncbi:MAG: orotidine 5'-phosphate decarboxylase [Deltaproteobacteria bacterium]|nr:orotidine 5'-phosphate decarboxylase [Deltaproteobacteria bacterium]
MIMNQTRSLIPACDLDVEQYEKLLKETGNHPGIGAYKIGFMLGLSIGLPRAVEIARKYTDKPLIYDHQKAATDIPDTGKKFCKVCKDAGIDVVIFFPQAGPETEKAWITAAREEELGVIVGGLMTHKSYARSDGGWIADEAIMEMYRTAAKLGVSDYVVPGTKPQETVKIRDMLALEGIDHSFYSPGLGAQGGDIAQAAKAAGAKFHAIIGRSLYNAKDMRSAADALYHELIQGA